MSRRAWAAVALALALGLAWAAISHRVYNRTISYALVERVFGEDADGEWLSLLVMVRKASSVVAFGLMAFVADKALPATRRPALRAVLIGAAFSALVEVAQKLHHAPEGLLSNAVDVACGALGGWLAIVVGRALTRRGSAAASRR